MTIHYRLQPSHPAAHLFQVTCTVPEPSPDGQAFWLPTWIPGSYMIREFSKNIVTATASCGGEPVRLRRVDKNTWQADPCEGPLELTYEVYAWDLSVRAAHLDQTHGFFNGTSVFLAAKGFEDGRHTVELLAPDDHPDWKVATSLPRTSGGDLAFGSFEADDYDALVDHPVEMGTFTWATFEACGTPHAIAITGRHRADVDRLVADLVPICEQHIRLFGEPCPVDRYVFLLTVTGDGYGGLEHRASSANMCSRASLPVPGITGVTEEYRQLLGLLSHEYFHTWNVKRIKPAAYTPYALDREAYTTLLWAFEGITSYYDDLGLLRCGRIDTKSWLELVGRNATRVLRGPGRFKQSLADSSFDAWTKFYRQDENAPNAIVSYYGKGALVAMALDLVIRAETDNAQSLDDVMRELWRRHGQTGQGVPEGGVEAIASQIAGTDLTGFFDLAIRGTVDVPLPELLARVGVRWRSRPTEAYKDKGGKPSKTLDTRLPEPGTLGARIARAVHGAKLSQVFDGGAAQEAGLSARDVVIAVDGLKVDATNLVKTLARHPAGATVEVHAFRRDELMTFSVALQPGTPDTLWLELDDAADADTLARREAWLQG